MGTIDYKGTSGNDENSSRYWVRGWFVEDSPKEGSNIINGHRVSRFYSTRAEAESQLGAIRKHYPRANVTNTTVFYVAGKRDAESRTEFLAEMGLPPEAEFIDGQMRVPAGLGDFLRTDYRICTSADCPCLMNSPCYYWQGSNDPLHIVIRADAMDGDLEYMAERFHIPVDEMKKFRATL